MGKWDLRLVEKAFADAAIDPSRWCGAMEIVAQVTGSFGAALLPVSGRLPILPHSPSLAEPFNTYVKDGWVHRDERYRFVPTLLKRGVASDLDFTRPEEMARHPYYQEFLAPYGLQWCSCVLVASGDDQWGLSIQRSVKQGPFLPKEIDLFAKLSKHLAAAAALSRALGFSALNMALEAYELSGTAVVCLNRQGEVIRLNAMAENILGCGVRVSKKRLIADEHGATVALDRALHALIWGDGLALLPPVPLPRRDRLPLLAHPMKPSTLAQNVFAESQALLVLVDPEKRAYPPEATLQAVFELTPAEARLASALHA